MCLIITLTITGGDRRVGDAQNGTFPRGWVPWYRSGMPKIAGKSFDIDQVKNVLAGYAFATRELRFRPPKSMPLGETPDLSAVPRWAYRSFDCVGSTSGPLSDGDLLIAAGLNGRLSSEKFLAMRAVAPLVSDALASMPADQTFWDLHRDHIKAVPPEGSPAYGLWRAWRLMEGTPGIGVALSHKTLHHKRPRLAPLIDGKTVKRTGWIGIYDDLQSQASEFADLEDWFGDLAIRNSGVAISRLRIHDILLWCSVTGELDRAERAGRKILDGS